MIPKTNTRLNQTPASTALQIVSNDNFKNLPGLATVNDVRDVVQFLKRHKDGVTIVQALDSLRKKTFDPRKLEAYDFWGIVVRSGDRIRLSDLGWEMAQLRAPEADFFRKLLSQHETYWFTLEWIQQQELQLVSYVELCSFWRESELEGLQFASDKEMQSSAGSFLQLCHAADLGVLLVGRKGQPTRLHIHADELSAMLSAGVVTETNTLAFRVLPKIEARYIRANFKTNRRQRVFIGSTSGIDSIKRLLEILNLALVDHEFASITTGERMTMADNLEQMTQCHTAILVITKDACDQKGEISADTLILLGAAIMHFKTRLLLLLEDGLCLPSVPLTPHMFDRDLSWESAVEVLSFVKSPESD